MFKHSTCLKIKCLRITIAIKITYHGVSVTFVIKYFVIKVFLEVLKGLVEDIKNCCRDFIFENTK